MAKVYTNYDVSFKNVTITDAEYPDYPTITCQIVYMKGGSELPVKDQSVSMSVDISTTSNTNYVLVRSASTDKEGWVTFHLFPIHKHDNSTHYNHFYRVLQPWIRNGTITREIPSYTDSSYYDLLPVTENSLRYNFKLEFKECEERNYSDKANDDGDENYNLFHANTYISKDNGKSIGWWKGKNKIYLARCYGKKNSDGVYELQGNFNQELWVHYVHASDGISYADSSLSYTVNVNSNNTRNITVKDSSSNSTTITNGTTTSRTVKTNTTGTSGLAWINVGYCTEGATAIITVKSDGNLFYEPCSFTLKTKWTPFTEKIYYTSFSIQESPSSSNPPSIYHPNSITIKSSWWNSHTSATGPLNQRLLVVEENGVKLIQDYTGSDGTFTYTVNNPSVKGINDVNVYEIYNYSNDKSRITINIQHLNNYSISSVTPLNDADKHTFSTEEWVLNLKNGGELLNGTKDVEVIVEHTRNSRYTNSTEGWDGYRDSNDTFHAFEGAYHCFKDTVQSDKGVIKYKLGKIIRDDDGNGIGYDKGSVKYAGNYFFTFKYAPNNGHGVKIKSQMITISPIGTKLRNNGKNSDGTYRWNEQPDIPTGKTAGQDGAINIRIYDDNGVYVPSGFVSRKVFNSVKKGTSTKIELIGRPHDGDSNNSVHLYDGNGFSQSYSSVISGTQGGASCHLVPENRGDVTVSMTMTFLPKGGNYQDMYKSSSITKTITWDKITPSLTFVSKTGNPLYVKQQGNLTVLYKHKNPKLNETTSTGSDGAKDYGVKPIANKTIYFSKPSFEDVSEGVAVTGSLSPSSGSVNTDNNGKATVGYTPTNVGDIKGIFTLSTVEDDLYKAVSVSFSQENQKLTWLRIPTTISYPENQNTNLNSSNYVTRSCSATVVLKDKNNTILGGKNISFEVYIPSTSSASIYGTTLTTNTNTGQVTGSYKNETDGGVKGKFRFKFDGDLIYDSSNYFTTSDIIWNKIPTILTTSFSPTTKSNTVTDPISVNITLETNIPNEERVVLKNKAITTELLDFKDLDNNTSISITGTGSNKQSYSGTSLRNLPSATTNENGVAQTSFTVTSKGNVKGTYSFTYPENNIYLSSTDSSSVTWNKIKPIYEIAYYTTSVQYVLSQCTGQVKVTYKDGTGTTKAIKQDYPLTIVRKISFYKTVGSADNTSGNAISVRCQDTDDGKEYTGSTVTLTPKVLPGNADNDAKTHISSHIIPLNKGDIHGEFFFGNTATDIYSYSTISFGDKIVNWMKRPVVFKYVENSKDDKGNEVENNHYKTIYVGDPCKLTLKVIDTTTGRVVPYVDIYKRITFRDSDNKVLNSSSNPKFRDKVENTTPTNEEGIISASWKYTKEDYYIGNVYGSFYFEIVCDEDFDVYTSNYEESIFVLDDENMSPRSDSNGDSIICAYWKKIPTEFVPVSKTLNAGNKARTLGIDEKYNVEVTIRGTLTAQLREKERYNPQTGTINTNCLAIPNAPVSTGIIWTNNTSPSSNTVTGVDGKSVEVISDHFTTPSNKTDSNGLISSAYRPQNIGDVIGKFSFTYNGDPVYEPRSTPNYNTAYNKDWAILWEKIKTMVYDVHDVEVYDSRHTNLKDITIKEDTWQKCSPGSKESYHGFTASVKVKDTETSFTHPTEGYIAYYYYNSNGVLDEINYSNVPGNNFHIQPVDENGVSKMRWTYARNDNGRLLGPSDPDYWDITRRTYYARYNETNLFRASDDVPMTYTILPRIPTNISFNYTPYPGHPTPRYNIPFTITILLEEMDKNDNLTGMGGQSINAYWNKDADKNYMSMGAPLTTGSDGVVNILNFRVTDRQSEGEDVDYPYNFPVLYEFDPTDCIDKYTPDSIEGKIRVDKDYPYLVFSQLPVTKTNACGDDSRFLETVTLYNSISEPIKTNEEIIWGINIADSYDGNRWEVNDLGVRITTTNILGMTSNTFLARSAVKLIRARLAVTWRYYACHIISWIIWDLFVKYGAKSNDTIMVTDGKANKTVDCQLPVGLYDLRIEYIGPEEENGCKTYADEVEYYGVHRKKGTTFKLDNAGSLEKEIYKQFEVTTTLENEDKLLLSNSHVITDVNDKNKFNQKTDADAKVTRHHMEETVNATDYFNFTYPQTRKQAGNVTTFEGHSLPHKPILAIVDEEGNEFYKTYDDNGRAKYYQRLISPGNFFESEIDKELYEDKTYINNYEYNNFTMKVRAFYYRKLYDDYGEEVKKYNGTNSRFTGGNIYKRYTSEGDPTYKVWKTVNGRYQRMDDEENKATANDYENAISYHIFKAIPDSELVWREGSGDNLTYPAEDGSELRNVIVTTDKNGFGTVTEYHRHTLGEANVKIYLENNEKFDSKEYLQLKLNTLARIPTTISEGVLDDVHYNEPCYLDCYIRETSSNTPVPSAPVIFIDDEGVEEKVATNSDGYAVRKNSYIPKPWSNDVKEKTKSHYIYYDVTFNDHQKWKHTSKTLRVFKDKQQPLLSARIDLAGTDLSVKYGASLDATFSGLFTQSLKSVEKLKPIPNAHIYFYLVPESVYTTSSEPFPVSRLVPLKFKSGEGYVKTNNGDKTNKNNFLSNRAIIEPEGSGNFKVWCRFNDEEFEEAPNVKYHSAYAFAKDKNGNDLILSVTQQTVKLTPEDVKYVQAFDKNTQTTSATLSDEKGNPITDKKISVTVKRGTTTIGSGTLTTTGTGKVNVSFVNGTATSYTSSGSKLTVTLKNGVDNFAKTYDITYSFNKGGTVDANYSGVEATNSVVFEKASTRFVDYADPLPDKTFKIILECNEKNCPDNMKLVKSANVDFYKDKKSDTNKLNSAQISTDSKGVATLGNVTDNNFKMISVFNGNDNYKACDKTSTYNGDDEVEPCNNLGDFYSYWEKVYYYWYNEPTRNFRNNMQRITMGTGKPLHTYTTGYSLPSSGKYYPGNTSEESEECVAATRGIALRSNKISTTLNCVVTFEVKFAYTGEPHVFLGHFGLWRKDGVSPESSSARFETYLYPGGDGGNAYFMQNADRATEKFKRLEAGKWHEVKFDLTQIEGKNQSICRGIVNGETYTLSKPVNPNLAVYVMCATKDSELRVRRISMNKKK